MSLYWPEKKVAVEIVDDPLAQPFDRAAHPDVRVLEVTCDELDDWQSSLIFFDRLSIALGQTPPPKKPSWLVRNRALHDALMRDMPKYWK